MGKAATPIRPSRSRPRRTFAVAPEPITKRVARARNPAWSPDGISLGFIRTSGGVRRLGVFNATPGIQTIVNPLVSLGAEAPSPQTRVYQEVWGGLSLADAPPSTAPQIGVRRPTCLAPAALGASSGGNGHPLPVAVPPQPPSGIFVVRVVGKRKLLGRSAPRVRVVGKVPLGLAKKGRNRKRWNGKVNGKRLRPGTYLLTYRSLKGRRVLSLSRSIRFDGWPAAAGE